MYSLSRLAPLALLLVTLVGADFTGLYGNYVTDATDLAGCRSSTSGCNPNICCVLNVTWTGPIGNNYSQGSASFFFDPQTASRCGANPNSAYSALGTFGITSETTGDVYTTTLTTIASTPIRFVFTKGGSPTVTSVLGSTSQCQEQASMVRPPSTSSSALPSEALSLLLCLTVATLWAMV